MEEETRKNVEGKKKLEEERKKRFTERNELAKQNEIERTANREQKRKASEAALEALVQSRKRARRM